MDSLGGGIANADLSKLSDRDKQELQQFAMNEGQKARIQSCMAFLSIHPTPLYISISPCRLFYPTPAHLERGRSVTTG
jgi:import inner membrane translocase subunit TIM8